MNRSPTSGRDTKADQPRGWPLRFEPHLEREFRDEHGGASPRAVRIVLAIAIVLYGGYGIVDTLLFPDQAPLLLTIRFAGFTPAAVVVFALTWLPGFARIREYALAALVVIAGSSIALYLLITPLPENYTYLPGIVVVLLFGYSFNLMRVDVASVAGALIIAALNLGVVVTPAIPFGVVLSANIVIIAANLAGMSACYMIERARRSAFLVQRGLEARVAQRTRALRSEVAERRAAQDRLTYLAEHDELTGLYNRRRTIELLEERERALGPGERIGVLFVDIDRFKAINDSIGHAVGDAVLRETAVRLVSCVPEEMVVGRLGGDEFLAHVAHADAAAVSEKLAAVMIECLGEPMVIDGHSIHVTPSIGIATLPTESASTRDVIGRADAAMYAAKRAGGGRSCRYDTDLGARIERRTRLEHELRAALETDALSLVYQPKIRLADEEITGYEVLLRWDSATDGPVSPAEFVPIAEETGLILPIGAWVLGSACAEFVRRAPADARLNVNISARQFAEPELVEMVADALARCGMESERLVVELTESAVMQSIDEAEHRMREIRALGAGIAIDDFGTGYSSLSYLSRFPLSELKIDRVFVGGLGTDARATAISRTILQLGHSLGARVVAEGVETREQATILRDWGCDLAQGFLFGRPLPLAAVARAG